MVRGFLVFARQLHALDEANADWWATELPSDDTWSVQTGPSPIDFVVLSIYYSKDKKKVVQVIDPPTEAGRGFIIVFNPPLEIKDARIWLDLWYMHVHDIVDRESEYVGEAPELIFKCHDVFSKPLLVAKKETKQHI